MSSGVVAWRKASALAMVPLNSGSTITALASPWSSMKAMVSGSSRVFRALSTAPAMGTPKWASTMGGVLGSMTATVSFLPMPARCRALASWRQRVYVWLQVCRRLPCTMARRSGYTSAVRWMKPRGDCGAKLAGLRGRCWSYFEVITSILGLKTGNRPLERPRLTGR